MIWTHLWPGGTWWSGFDAVWPNVLASGLLFTSGYFLAVRRHLRALHAKLDKLHHKIDQHDLYEG